MKEPHFVTREGAIADIEYLSWLAQVKQQYRSSQAKAAMRVNSTMLEFYWTLGADILRMQREQGWGNGIIKQLSLDMRKEFPEVTGFSVRNSEGMKRWYNFYYQQVINAQQPVAQISHQPGAILPAMVQEAENQLIGAKSQQPVAFLPMPDAFALVPWGHHVEISYKCRTLDEALFYVGQVIACNWSRETLAVHIKDGLYHRQGAAITNFDDLVPSDQSRLAQSMLKGSYHLDFLNLGPEHSERQLEDALAENITRFLLELGQGFSYVGRQMELRMDEETSFFPDLVFYHYRQRRFVVVELKAREFQPEHAGKINFYVNAADKLLRGEGDQDSVGLLICRTAKRAVVEWSLKGINTPLGVATYQLEELVNRTIAEVEQSTKK